MVQQSAYIAHEQRKERPTKEVANIEEMAEDGGRMADGSRMAA
jgi:hypothetical protein